jgi:hypothetical protein
MKRCINKWQALNLATILSLENKREYEFSCFLTLSCKPSILFEDNEGNQLVLTENNAISKLPKEKRLWGGRQGAVK